MKALIDADIFQYEFGSVTDDEFKPLPWPLIQARIQGRINGILEATAADEYQLYVTSDDKSNFRFDVATILPYKDNRKGKEKPFWYTHIRNFLVDQRGAIEIFGMEADDAISIEMHKAWEKCLDETTNEYKPTPTTICCSRDKDLRMCPGWHYSWGGGKQKERPVYFQNELDGLRMFYCQLLTGDSVDNIPGLFGVGKSSTHLRYVTDSGSECEMYRIVKEQYIKRFGSYADNFLNENARLLWMLQHEGQVWEAPKDDTE